MQWENRVSKKNSGLTGITVLLVALILLGGFQGLLLVAEREQCSLGSYIRSAQELELGESLIKAARKIKQRKPEQTVDIKTQTILYPGSEVANLAVTEVNDKLLGIYELKAKIITKSNNVTVFGNTFFPPGGKNDLIYQKDFFATQGVVGAALDKSITVKQGIVSPLLKSLDVTRYKKYHTLYLPTSDELEKFGLGNRLYYGMEHDGTYRIKPGSSITGNGMLIAEQSMELGDGCFNKGRIILLSGSGIIVGNNVNLSNVLLIAKKNISIGNDTIISGIIISG
ncbi:MAG TPA: hypothetical protein IAB06_05745, partial [Candidatus Avacidaminococcus intestinavium]|nr:hypothetical protein [Candidatus Avacidaminococcus intestinavium]